VLNVHVIIACQQRTVNGVTLTIYKFSVQLLHAALHIVLFDGEVSDTCDTPMSAMSMIRVTKCVSLQNHMCAHGMWRRMVSHAHNTSQS